MEGSSPFGLHDGSECQESKCRQFLPAPDAVFPGLGDINDQRLMLRVNWHASDVKSLAPCVNP